MRRMLLQSSPFLLHRVPVDRRQFGQSLLLALLLLLLRGLGHRGFAFLPGTECPRHLSTGGWTFAER